MSRCFEPISYGLWTTIDVGMVYLSYSDHIQDHHSSGASSNNNKRQPRKRQLLTIRIDGTRHDITVGLDGQTLQIVEAEREERFEYPRI